MENHMDHAGRPLSSTGTHVFSSASLRRRRKKNLERRGRSFVTGKGALFSGLALLLILGVSLTVISRLIPGLPGNEKWSFQTGSGSIHAVSPTIANDIIYSGSNRYLYALDASGRQQWAFDMEGIIASSPAVANGIVYVGANDAFGHLYALDARSGRQKWQFQQVDGYIESSPVVVGGIVYIGSSSASSDGNFYALDALSGSKKWSFQTGGTIESVPVVANNVVYVSSSDAKLYAIQILS